MALGGSCGAEGTHARTHACAGRGMAEGGAHCRAWALRCRSIPVLASFSRVVSDNCYPFSGREQNEASPTPRCMMHSRAMGRGKRQATSRCPNGQVDSNDIYQVTPVYRLGSDVSLNMGRERKLGLRVWSDKPYTDGLSSPGEGDHEGANGKRPRSR